LAPLPLPVTKRRGEKKRREEKRRKGAHICLSSTTRNWEEKRSKGGLQRHRVLSAEAVAGFREKKEEERTLPSLYHDLRQFRRGKTLERFAHSALLSLQTSPLFEGGRGGRE